MSFDSKRIEFAREHIYIVELELDYCSNTFGVAPCTASGSGDAKCFNTIETTQDLPNYTLTGITTGEQTISVVAAGKTFTRSAGSYLTDGFKVGHTVTSSGFTNAGNNQSELLISAVTATVMTFSTATGLVNETGDANEVITLNATLVYRFCEQRSPHPIGLEAIPSIVKGGVSIAPAKIDIRGGLGVRSSVSIQFTDQPTSDIDVDQYVGERTWIAFERGTFWTKLRARNPNYQNRAMRVLSGYLENGVFLEENFQVRHYIIDKINVSGGQATVTGKDPLKLASSRKAQVPAPSTGLLNAAITDVATELTLKPAGVGDDEYPSTAGGSFKVTIKSEVMEVTTRAGDVLTLVRGQNNTVAIAHNVNDTVQLAYEKNDQVNIIVKDLLTNFANVDPAFIPDTSWQSEVDTFLSGLLDGIITKPIDVNKVLMELSEAMPHYLWWDERTQEIQLTALKAPPSSADVLDMDENLIRDSVVVTDLTDMRTSTVFVNFGQVDPTMRLDEPNNYEQTYVRIDTDSITKFGSSVIKTVNSRWISNSNKAAALQLAALIGRRLSDIPRGINFSLDAKDAEVWIGQSRSINHRDIVDATGIPVDTVFELTSVKESENYEYSGIEFVYGDALPEDEGGGDPNVDLVIFGSNQDNINLRTIYDSLFPAPDASTQAKFIIENGVVIGSTSIGTDALDTGTWPAGAIITLQTDTGSFVVGKGGVGAGTITGAAESGGDAVNMQFDLIIINNGIIGSGGGGGGRDTDVGDETGEAAGGGGAGSDIGARGTATTYSTGIPDTIIAAENGTLENGGDGGKVDDLDTVLAIGGDGGDLGQAGQTKDTAGGAPGIAIKKNGNVLTETVSGDIRGAIV